MQSHVILPLPHGFTNPMYYSLRDQDSSPIFDLTRQR